MPAGTGRSAGSAACRGRKQKAAHQSEDNGIIIPTKGRFGLSPCDITKYDAKSGENETNSNGHVHWGLIGGIKISLRKTA